ncbi:MAG: hypothetical protein KKH67_13745 [candidate division Zixibacteria bacterium]|nr:hypothetical protein [candidate division Zixibacteria bacterium]MBU1470558.1 hypothetical protein [candidate division Zixibacteria bacterium]
MKISPLLQNEVQLRWHPLAGACSCPRVGKKSILHADRSHRLLFRGTPDFFAVTLRWATGSALDSGWPHLRILASAATGRNAEETQEVLQYQNCKK